MGVAGKMMEIIVAAVSFVFVRRKDSGGFGATPRLPATIEDTWHALRILALAGHHGAAADRVHELGEDDALRSFLDRWNCDSPVGLKTRYQLHWCRRYLGMSPLPWGERERVSSALEKKECLPEECYYGLRNLLESGAREAADRIVARLPLPDIFFSARFCVREAAMLLHLCRLLDLPLPVSSGELADWLRSCQNGDGGFGFYPHTTSFIENTHAALEALALLGAGPLHPQRAFDYLIGCRTACGGFGRGSRTAPFLDATWHGVAGLSLAAGFLSA